MSSRLELPVGVDSGGHGAALPLVPKLLADLGTVYLVLDVIMFPPNGQNHLAAKAAGCS